MKGHLNNLLPEIPHLLPPPLRTECQQITDTTLPKGKVSGAFLRVATIKFLLKLQREQVDPMIVMLLETVVRMSEILYSQDSRRNPKMILRLYNCSWLHHELCCHFLFTPKLQTRSHLFGAYLHALSSPRSSTIPACVYVQPMLRVKKGFSAKQNISVLRQPIASPTMSYLPFSSAYKHSRKWVIVNNP